MSSSLSTACRLLRREAAEGARLAREAYKSHRDDPTTLGFIGVAVGYLDRDYEFARNAIDRAIVLNPNSATLLSRKAYFENWMENTSVAEACIRRAVRLSPLDPEMGWFHFGLANALMKAGRWDEALTEALASIREIPEFVPGYMPVIRCLVELARVVQPRIGTPICLCD